VLLGDTLEKDNREKDDAEHRKIYKRHGSAPAVSVCHSDDSSLS